MRPLFALIPLSLVLLSARPASASKPEVPAVTAKQQLDLNAGKLVFVTEKSAGGASVVTGIAEIKVSHERLWKLLLNTAEIKRASKSVKELNTYEDAPGPNGTRIIKLDYLVKSGPIKLRYYVKRECFTSQNYMTWILDTERDSDILATTGSYSTHDAARDGYVVFLYRASIDVGKNVPAWVEERLAASSLKRYLLHIKEIAETGVVETP
jgi:hypothetical protein